jgi:hypothetical protein
MGGYKEEEEEEEEYEEEEEEEEEDGVINDFLFSLFTLSRMVIIISFNKSKYLRNNSIDLNLSNSFLKSLKFSFNSISSLLLLLLLLLLFISFFIPLILCLFMGDL